MAGFAGDTAGLVDGNPAQMWEVGAAAAAGRQQTAPQTLLETKFGVAAAAQGNLDGMGREL